MKKLWIKLKSLPRFFANLPKKSTRYWISGHSNFQLACAENGAFAEVHMWRKRFCEEKVKNALPDFDLRPYDYFRSFKSVDLLKFGVDSMYEKAFDAAFKKKNPELFKDA